MRLSSTAKSCFCSGASRCISNDMAPALPLVGRSSASPPLTILPCAILYDVLREGHKRKWVIVTRKSSWRPARPTDVHPRAIGTGRAARTTMSLCPWFSGRTYAFFGARATARRCRRCWILAVRTLLYDYYSEPHFGNHATRWKTARSCKLLRTPCSLSTPHLGRECDEVEPAGRAGAALLMRPEQAERLPSASLR